MMMEMEKTSFKRGFLRFFDWNGKSQKNRLSDNPNLPEASKQGKENMDNMPKSQINMDDKGENPSNIASCDVECAMSISSDEGYGTKAPGLVARLMGLDSLPVSTISECSSSTSLHGSNSCGSSHCHEGALHDYFPVDSIHMQLQLDKSSWSAMEPEAQKVGNQAIKRFQTEMLPPKCAKPIPVTHTKLLSPIKSHGHLQLTNDAHILENAAKIIESSPWPCGKSNNRISPLGTSSVSLSILDLKEKLEAAQYESKFTAIPLNGRPSERSNKLYKSTQTFKGSRYSGRNSSCQLVRKGKSFSPTKPSKTNVETRDALTSDVNRVYVKMKEQNEIKSNQLTGSQKKRITDRALVAAQKDSTVQKNNVLWKNSVTNKGKPTSKVDSNKPTQTSFTKSSIRGRKNTNKDAVNTNIERKKSGTSVTGPQKEFQVSKSKNTSQKNKCLSRDACNKPGGSDNAVKKYEKKSIKCNITSGGGSSGQDAFSMKESNDVISFTFTSPMRTNRPESQPSIEQVMGTRNRIDVNSCSHRHKLHPKDLPLSPPRLHAIDGDALGVLLEKKLQELTYRINQPQCTLIIEGSSAGLRLDDKFESVASTTAKEKRRISHSYLLSKKLDSMHENCCSSSDNTVLHVNQQLQISEAMEEPSCSSNSESRYGLSCYHMRAVSVSEKSFLNESYLDSEDSACGSTVCSSMQDEEISTFTPINESISQKNDAKWSEQSSSIVVVDNNAIKQSRSMSDSVEFTRSARNMELEYVKDILRNAELMTEEFVIGQTEKIIIPNLFDLLENKSIECKNYQEYSKLERKAIFDTVNEWLELRCRQVFVGRCKRWPRWERKSLLAEELYKEMLCFTSMEEVVMVDELVNKDMCIQGGTWHDFDIEAFEEGSELEFDIITYLINELVSDLLHV